MSPVSTLNNFNYGKKVASCNTLAYRKDNKIYFGACCIQRTSEQCYYPKLGGKQYYNYSQILLELELVTGKSLVIEFKNLLSQVST